MRGVSDEAAEAANNCAAESRREVSGPNHRGNILPQAEWFALMAREIWRFKVAANVQAHTGYAERTCRSWGSAESEPPARVLALLLRSDDGPRVLEYIMRENPPGWYTALRQAHDALGIFSST